MYPLSSRFSLLWIHLAIFLKTDAIRKFLSLKKILLQLSQGKTYKKMIFSLVDNIG